MEDNSVPNNPFKYLERNAELQPDELGLVGPELRLSWRELHVLVLKVAAKLRFLGFRPGDRAMLALDKTSSWVIQLALFHEAAVSVGRDLNALKRVSVDWVLAPKGLESFSRDKTLIVNKEWFDDARSRFKAQEGHDYDEGDLIRISLSSGTTGTPKAIPITAKLLKSRYDNDEAFWRYPQPFVSILGFDSAVGWQSPIRSLVGALPYLALSIKDSNQWDFLIENEVRTIAASPIQLAELMSKLPADANPPLELLITAGSALPTELARHIKKRLENIEIWNNYGSTEAGGAASKVIGDNDNPLIAGKVIRKAKVAILDDQGNELPIGQTGRIAVKNPGMVDGYLEDEEATRAAFVNGWFLPGDLGFIDENDDLWLEGRISEVINVGGKKVNPELIDQFLLQQPGVLDAASFAFSDGHGMIIPVVALVTTPGADVKDIATQMKAGLRSNAPRIVISVKEIPRNENGKPLRRNLAERERASLEKLIRNSR